MMSISSSYKRRRSSSITTNNMDTTTSNSTDDNYYTLRNNIISVSHISSISDSHQRALIDFEVYLDVSVWLAWYHITRYQASLLSSSTTSLSSQHQLLVSLSDVHEQLTTCNIDFHLSMYDTQFSAINAARELVNAYNTIQEEEVEAETNSVSNTSEAQIPSTVLVGTLRSVETSSISYLASAYDIPQIAGTSTASYLNQRDSYPLLTRTVPTNMGDALAIVLYVQQYIQITHVNIIYIADGYGNDFHSDLVKELVAANISVNSVQYDDNAIEVAIQQIVISDIKYIIAILNPGTWRTLIRLAYQYRIIGQSDYVWIFTESLLEYTSPDFHLNRVDESDIALALHGTAIVSAMEPYNELFENELIQFSTNQTMQQLYINQHKDSYIFENYTFTRPGSSIYQYLSYDAVLAMTLASCNVQHQDNNYPDNNNNNDTLSNTTTTTTSTFGRRIYDHLLQTKFRGVSGYVSFDPNTGTRQSQNIIYSVRNILLLDTNSTSSSSMTNESYHYTSNITSIINLENKSIDHQLSFIYFNNDTVPPLSIPHIDIDMNLIPTGIRIFGYSLCGFVMILSLWWIVWTFRNRNKDIVKASQPIFLYQLCIGTILIVSSIIPMSFQEPINSNSLSIACMASPWLISIGFVTSFSALFTKTWRLNKLFHHGRNLRRIIIRPIDVVLPFIILMIINITVMLIWTIDAPLVWVRSYVNNYDTFGRNVESVGKCIPSNTQRGTIYLTLIVVIDISVLIFANYQAYIARNLPTDFSESTYIIIAMGSLLEVCIVGIPLLFLESFDTTINFVIRSMLAAITCLSILLPIFVPKFIRRRHRQRYSDVHRMVHGHVPSRSKVHVSRNIANQSNSLLNESSIVQNDDVVSSGMLRITRKEEYFQELVASMNINNTNNSDSMTMKRRQSSKCDDSRPNESTGTKNNQSVKMDQSACECSIENIDHTNNDNDNTLTQSPTQ